MSPRRILTTVAAVIGVLAVFVGGVIVGGHAQATGLTELSDPVRGVLLGDSGQDLSGQVLDLLKDQYYVPVDSQKLQLTSVDAMVAGLKDPYTDYLSPDELEALREHNDGTYHGVGLQVAQRDAAVVVAAVFPDSPAAKAKVRAGDVIVSVDGASTTGQDLATVVGKIRGKEGTTVKIGVRTGDAPPRVLTLERSRIKVPAVTSRIVTVDGKKVGYMRLAAFTRGAGDALRTAVKDLRAKGAVALVFDLRGDPGGLVTEAINVAGVFLPDGSEVVVTHGEHSPRHVYRTHAEPVAGDLPLVVLVDEGSASASEIVAGALRDAKRGVLVGQRTFGKALVQSTIPLRNGGALKLTTARYLTPSGYDLAKRGLPPSVKVLDDPATKPDEALQRGLDLAAAKA